ncbi:MAG: hypothetical protein JXA33_03090 [Anaerolineae bacterium]|nr:hypothetical protein [Anaerolineae bacterium]
MIWLGVGLLAGLVNLQVLAKTLAIVHPGVLSKLIVSVVIGSFILRMGTLTVILWLALRQGVVPLLFTFAGFWLSRWYFIKKGT